MTDRERPSTALPNTARPDGDSFIDLTDRPADGQALTIWRAKRLVAEMRDAMIARAGEHAKLLRADVYEAGLVITTRISANEAAQNSFFDPKRLGTPNPETGKPNPGRLLHRVEAEDGKGLVYPRGDKTAKPRAYPDTFKALERTLTQPDTRHLATLTDGLITTLASNKFNRAIPKQAYAPPRPMQ